MVIYLFTWIEPVEISTGNILINEFFSILLLLGTSIPLFRATDTLSQMLLDICPIPLRLGVGPSREAISFDGLLRIVRG